jgi:hypothetical protein
MGKHLVVFTPVTKPPRLEKFDPMRGDTAQRLHGQLVKSTAKEVLEGIDIANVEGVRFLSHNLNRLFIIIIIITVIASRVGLAVWR